MTSYTGKDKAQRYVVLTMSPREAKTLAEALDVISGVLVMRGRTWAPVMTAARRARQHLEKPGVKLEPEGRS